MNEMGNDRVQRSRDVFLLLRMGHFGLLFLGWCLCCCPLEKTAWNRNKSPRSGAESRLSLGPRGSWSVRNMSQFLGQAAPAGLRRLAGHGGATAIRAHAPGRCAAKLYQIINDKSGRFGSQPGFDWRGDFEGKRDASLAETASHRTR